jgi:mono/diheme cytochrome c family protein
MLHEVLAHRKAGLFVATLLIIALAVAPLLTACLPNDRVGDYGKDSFESNGERIYFTAESSSGGAISYSGGSFMMHQRVACVSCHGPEGKGGRVNMMMWSFNAPDITWDKLTQEEYHEEESTEGGHEEHPPYNEDTLKRAVTEGLDPAGEPLKAEMPRWKMSGQDLNDLFEFMKILE